MTGLTAEVHLKRAHALISRVEAATEQFRRSIIAHDESLEGDQPFLQMMATGFKGKRQLAQQKSALLSDISLAGEELDCTAGLDLDAHVATSDGRLDVLALREMASYATGQLELIDGNTKKAREIFTSTLEIADIPGPHYTLGLIYEDEYKPAEALREFEKCLELEPGGELSVPALRKARATKKYKKKFRGSWLLLVILLFIYYRARRCLFLLEV